jgi:hypothetical protein
MVPTIGGGGAALLRVAGAADLRVASLDRAPAPGHGRLHEHDAILRRRRARFNAAATRWRVSSLLSSSTRDWRYRREAERRAAPGSYEFAMDRDREPSICLDHARYPGHVMR